MLTAVNDFLVARMGETGPLLAIGGLGLMLILVTLPFLLKKEPEPFDKLKQQTRPARWCPAPRLRSQRQAEQVRPFP